ncbi:DUF3800 domain-containing protein [Streptomyces olivaceus]|uniref:DUF3800 domain-containing protein n=1 Tax=Streptomyces olivaceus TaxID=47716 RepID=UPI001CCB460C|nr:DUF3800 domain-containing protein [Streptomyces olivaceus]MBZ6142529.1 DUF3800 domain-containing protein [Streptomyces olivaceus]MBZ6170102.1 DUF3800 domain-containing protein [Streptomyces olivaceus]
MTSTNDPRVGTQSGPTTDGDTAGRWAACDESGWDGEQLIGRRGPYFVYAAVAVDDAEATEIVEELRAETHYQAPELKFRDFKKRANRRDALRRLWGDGGALEGRCWAFVVEKEYAAVAKVIDLLLEEQAYAAGIDLYADGRAREFARLLRQHGRRALGDQGYKRLMTAFVAFASVRGRRDDQAREVFFDRVEEAWASSTRRNITDLLMMLRTTRPQAEMLHGDTNTHPMLELLVSSVAQAARHWGAQLGPVSVLTDEQKALPDDGLDNIAKVVRNGWGATRSSRQRPVDLRALVRGTSVDHPSIQLADLVAGAVRVSFEHKAGTEISEAGEDLWPAIMPLLDGSSATPSLR